MRAYPLARRILTTLLALSLVALPSAQRDSPFMEEFRKLMKVHALDEMAELIRKNEFQAENAVVEVCNAIGQGSNDTLEAEIDALDQAWKKAFDEKFVEYYYGYVSVRLTGPIKRQRKELIDRYFRVRAGYDAAIEAKERNKIPAAALELRALGDAFGDLGDHYYETRCFAAYAAGFDEVGLGDEADLRRACEGWGLFLEASDELSRKGKFYDQAKVRFEKLEFDGYGDPSKGPAARAEKRAADDPAFAPRPFTGTFELADDLEAVQRPMYTADPVYQAWPSVYLAKEASTARLPALEKPFNLLRTGAAKLAVDLDSDGTGDVDVPLTGKLTPVRIERDTGNGPQPWAFQICIGQQGDTYQGFRLNMAPDENQMGIYYAPAASLVGTIGETRVQIFDDNMDGIYGSGPKEWNYIGLVAGSLEPHVDSILVGEGKVARPWSRLQEIGGLWYELERGEKGELMYKRAEVKTGKLELSFKGPKPTWLVVRGTGNNGELYYDVVNGGKNEVEVPVGSYYVYVGQLATGRRGQMTKALILPPKSPPSYSVTAGSSTTMELGAPFGFSFSFTQSDETVNIEGPSIAVTGRGGETYQRFWNCVPAPEVLIRKAGGKKGKKEGKLSPATSQEQIQDHQNDYSTVWFPVGEAIEKPSTGDKAEVQLFEKKNKLFGKIESDWKAE